MNDRITIEGPDGAFGAYIERPKVLPAPAVVVLHEVFGVNADIRKTCHELPQRGVIAVAPDRFRRQEPEGRPQRQLRTDWQQGLRFYQAYDRDAGARDVKDKGYNVSIVQNPTTSLADHVAVTNRIISAQDGPVLLVGHSYDGAVVTEAANNPKVAGVVTSPRSHLTAASQSHP